MKGTCPSPEVQAVVAAVVAVAVAVAVADVVAVVVDLVVLTWSSIKAVININSDGSDQE